MSVDNTPSGSTGNKPYYNAPQPPLLHTFPTYIPENLTRPECSENLLRPMATDNAAPYGYTHPEIGENIRVPSLNLSPKDNPLYHLKVTATRVDLPEGEGQPRYVFMASTKNDRVETTYMGRSVNDSKIISHIVPTNAKDPQIKIKPLRMMTEKEEEFLQSTQHNAHFQMPPDAGLGSANHCHQGDSLEGQEAKQELLSRPLTQDPHLLSQLNAGHPKMYHWVTPMEPAVTDGTESEDKSIEARNSLHPSGTDKYQKMFSQASQKLYNHLPSESESSTPESKPDQHIISSPLDDELGLPNELRPSVVYGGVQRAPAEFVGEKDPKGYKLHAIEVHQYIPIPGKEDPWIIKNRVDPCTTSTCGAIPLPFDPMFSGMVAPTFQKTHNNEPVPSICPEVFRMFNVELYSTVIPSNTPSAQPVTE